jgi:hypothetical protein
MQDTVNRRLTINILLQAAATNRTQQFIFITPHDIRHVSSTTSSRARIRSLARPRARPGCSGVREKQSPMIRIFELDAPERNQVRARRRLSSKRSPADRTAQSVLRMPGAAPAAADEAEGAQPPDA